MIIGIDPGGATTGVVGMTVQGEYLAHRLLYAKDSRNWGHYVAEIEDAVAYLSIWSEGLPVTVAIEDLSPPTPHMGVISVKGLLDTARVLGALHYRGGPSMVLVPPNNHGGLGRAAYPEKLIGKREGDALTGKLRHCRAAWDVAMSARNLN